MVRVGRDAYERTLTEPHVRPLEIGHRPATGFVLVDPDGFRNEAKLARWIQVGLDFVSTLPPKSSASRSHCFQRDLLCLHHRILRCVDLRAAATVPRAVTTEPMAFSQTTSVRFHTPSDTAAHL